MPRPFSSFEYVVTSFWNRVRKMDNCWMWTGTIDKNTGYGHFFPHQHMTILAHRFSYELNVAEIPKGLTIDHLCKVRLCVNPEHLEIVSLTENLHRGDGWSGKNHRKTHCPQGHRYDGNNLIITEAGFRQCRACHNVQSRNWSRRNNVR